MRCDDARARLSASCFAVAARAGSLAGPWQPAQLTSRGQRPPLRARQIRARWSRPSSPSPAWRRTKGQWTAFAEYATKDAVMFVPEPVNAQAMAQGRAQSRAQSVDWQPYQVLVELRRLARGDQGRVEAAGRLGRLFHHRVAAPGRRRRIQMGDGPGRHCWPSRSPAPEMIAADGRRVRLQTDAAADTARRAATTSFAQRRGARRHTALAAWWSSPTIRATVSASYWNGTDLEDALNLQRRCGQLARCSNCSSRPSSRCSW